MGKILIQFQFAWGCIEPSFTKSYNIKKYDVHIPLKIYFNYEQCANNLNKLKKSTTQIVAQIIS